MTRKKGSATRFPGVFRLSDGRYQLRWKVTCLKTGRELERAPIVEAKSAADAAQMRSDLQAATTGEPLAKRMKVGEYSTSWLTGKRKTLKPSTLDRYARTIAHHVVPQLGDHYVDTLTHQDIAEWRDAQDDKTSTINSRLRILKTMLADATIALDLPRDPSLRVAALSATGGEGYSEEEPNSLTADELALFLETAQREVPRRWHPLFATLAFTASRVGEATALKWDDITDIESPDGEGCIRIRRAHWRGRVGTQKTGNRVRVLPLPKELGAILRDHRRALHARLDDDKLTRRKREGLLAGLAAGWVFPNDKGGPTAAQVVRKPLMKVLAALNKKALEDETAGVDHLTTHGLRRTMNNLLRQVTHGEVVRSVTGHVTERMTEHYSHVRVEEKATAVAQVISLVRRTPTKVGLLVGPGASKS